MLLSGIIVFGLIIVSATFAYEPSVGVKEGDWIEYNISITGIGSPPPTHDVIWMRMQVLQVQGTAFSVNITSRYSNGTIGQLDISRPEVMTKDNISVTVDAVVFVKVVNTKDSLVNIRNV